MELVTVFPWLGPGRRSDLTVVEYHIGFAGRDLEYLAANGHRIESAVQRMLVEAGLMHDGGTLPGLDCHREPAARFSALSAATSLLFQQACGHRVSWFDVQMVTGDRVLCLVEHEDSDVGHSAVRLSWNFLSRKFRDLGAEFGKFSEYARPLALPEDTRAIIAAADARDIPVIKLNRQPFKEKKAPGVTTTSPSQANGLLMLGQGSKQRRLDGTFCIDTREASRNLMKDRDAMTGFLRSNGIPYLERGEASGGGVLTVVIANGHIIGNLDRPAGHQNPGIHDGPVHASIHDHVRRIWQELDSPCAAVSFQSPDYSVPLSEAGGGVIDVDPGPVLSELLPAGTELHRQAAAGIVNWLFPGEATGRIPVIAITGTNGKTTTTRMVSHILKEAGLEPGMVCSDGRYVNGNRESKGDASSLIGHARVLADARSHSAVLEAHHRGLMRRGFAFSWCDVGVCLNVTRDHIKAGEIESIEQLARIKQSLPQRARKAAILFADNPYCLDMVPHLSAEKTCLVSIRQSAKDLADLCDSQVVVEVIENRRSIVIHDGGHRQVIARLEDLPSCMGGAAEHNVSNAMHALAACHFAGIDLEVAAHAMKHFHMSFDVTPGRMNVHDNGSFRVIMDYAHNEDGLMQLCQFMDRQQVEGKKILMYSIAGDREDNEIRLSTRIPIGHFDHFVVRRFPQLRGRREHEIPMLMEKTLLEAGVPPEAITRAPGPHEAVEIILAMGKPGDLLVLTPNSKEIFTLWDRIIEA